MKNHYLLSVLMAALSIPRGHAVAQTFTTLYNFTNGSDGATPNGLVLSGKTLYGTAEYGGTWGNGTVFKVNTDGTGFGTLHVFSAQSGAGYVNSDGGYPEAGLILSGNTLYGTAYGGGTSGYGAVFLVNTDGTGFANLHNFTFGTQGSQPEAGLVISGNTLYGTGWGSGGTAGYLGTVFHVNIDGSGFATLHKFISASDGAAPQAGLVLSDNTLYGTAAQGGSWNNGTLFKVNTDGTGFTTLHIFSATFSDDQIGQVTNSDGAYPAGGLVLSGNTLYGTAALGGTGGGGTVFQVNTDGSGFAILYSFTNGSDGWNPQAGLILSGNTLYGTAYVGGTWNNGTAFQVNTDGTGFATLHSFTGGGDGANPHAELILSGNTLYGTAYVGGTSGYGTVFSLSLPLPQLTVIQSGTNVVLSWPANFTGFTVQSSTDLVSPAVWTPVAQAPMVVNGQNTVTTPISGTRQFYRLQE